MRATTKEAVGNERMRGAVSVTNCSMVGLGPGALNVALVKALAAEGPYLRIMYRVE